MDVEQVCLLQETSHVVAVQVTRFLERLEALLVQLAEVLAEQFFLAYQLLVEQSTEAKH